MIFSTYGDNQLPSLLFLHGMATTAQSCYGRILPYLDEYHIILCEIDGHSEKEPDLFKSIKAVCEKIEAYVIENLQGKIDGLVGFSMGATIAVELMTRNKIKMDKVILDAAFCVKMGIRSPIYTKLFCWALNWIKSNHSLPTRMIESVMGKGNYRIVDTFYQNIEIQSVKNACHDVYRYEISNELSNFKGKTVFWHGSNEYYPKKTAKLLKEYLPNMQVEEFEAMGHGQLLNEHPKEYADKIKHFMKQNK